MIRGAGRLLATAILALLVMPLEAAESNEPPTAAAAPSGANACEHCGGGGVIRCPTCLDPRELHGSCELCRGTARRPCESCGEGERAGRVPCMGCSGRGTAGNSAEPCFRCKGMKVELCSVCFGLGTLACNQSFPCVACGTSRTIRCPHCLASGAPTERVPPQPPVPAVSDGANLPLPAPENAAALEAKQFALEIELQQSLASTVAAELRSHAAIFARDSESSLRVFTKRIESYETAVERLDVYVLTKTRTDLARVRVRVSSALESWRLLRARFEEDRLSARAALEKQSAGAPAEPEKLTASEREAARGRLRPIRERLSGARRRLGELTMPVAQIFEMIAHLEDDLDALGEALGKSQALFDEEEARRQRRLERARRQLELALSAPVLPSHTIGESVDTLIEPAETSADVPPLPFEIAVSPVVSPEPGAIETEPPVTESTIVSARTPDGRATDGTLSWFLVTGASLGGFGVASSAAAFWWIRRRWFLAVFRVMRDASYVD